MGPFGSMYIRKIKFVTRYIAERERRRIAILLKGQRLELRPRKDDNHVCFRLFSQSNYILPTKLEESLGKRG